MNPDPEPTAPDAASESAIEHVFRAWREATGEQTHLVESMDIVDGLIARHLVCWGWVGFKKLHAAANNTPPAG